MNSSLMPWMRCLPTLFPVRSVGEFAVDDEECLIVWKGPGYSADATVARATGASCPAE